uniref:ATPase inhibitor, mitochondrial n=1 Tax=Felis catus TaxID=9685 RepID=A0ABI7ZTP4_FELCA
GHAGPRLQLRTGTLAGVSVVPSLSADPISSHLYRCSRLSPQSEDSRAGSIREAGGAFGKREQAEEERYFRARTREQLAALKKHHEDEISHHIKEIERLQKEIERHKKKIKHLKRDEEEDD